MFDYDWFHGPAFEQQQFEARLRCVLTHFPDLEPEKIESNEAACKFFEELELRRLIYLRDGFSYELKNVVEVESKAHFTFECEPVDDQYKVGAFVVAVPFEDIARVEVFAVHPAEKPDDMPAITGFRTKPEPQFGREAYIDRPRGGTED